jgi:betaine-aldehyde dehydrogenase
VYERDGFYIDGAWRPAAGGEDFVVLSPANEEPIGRIPKAGVQDIDVAVNAAQAAMENPAWREMRPAERADRLATMAEFLRVNADDWCRVNSAESGLPLAVLMTRKLGPAAILDYFAGLTRSFVFEEERATSSGARATVRHAPVGVVGAVIPFNGSLLGTCAKVAPAIAAGCSVVVKPALESPLQTFAVAEAAIHAGLPAGVVNIVPGGRDEGRHLVSHPAVSKVVFTGSTAAGREVAKGCGESLKRCMVELGGKAPTIVLDDAPIEAAAAAIAAGGFYNTGQACIAMSRVLAARSIYEDVVEALRAEAEKLRPGLPDQEETTIGPLMSRAQLERVERYVELGRSEGGIVAAGGRRPPDLQKGWFYEPTVFRDMTNEMRLSREEVFGPVIVVIPFADDDEAVSIANDSPYGLSGSVFTGDVQRGRAIADRVQVGVLGINGFSLDFGLPFGGVKASGFGREFGPEGLVAYTEPKVVVEVG